MFADLKFALRQFAKAPGFAAVAVITLALAIGACTAIFSVVNGVLLRPLAYPAPDQIMAIRASNLPAFPEFSVSPPDFLDWERQSRSFAALAATRDAPINFTGDHEPQRLNGVAVTAHYFEVYGVTPSRGRAFLPEEDAPGKNHVAILSDAFWRRAFGATDVLGQTVQLNGEPYAIVGIESPGFGAANRTDVWVPIGFGTTETSDAARGSHYLGVVGRLKPGVTVAQADADLKLIAGQLAQKYPDSNKGWSVFVTPLLEYNVRDVRPTLYTLLGAVGCVLLIACANIANLLLARATARHREISIRAALGAGRTRLIRQLLSESVLLALIGGGAGVLLARWGLDVLLALAPDLPRTGEVRLDTRVLAFSLALSVVTGLVFGLAPAWLAAQTNVNEALKQGSRGSTDAGARGRVRGLLVVLEVAFALVLLAAAGLLVRSFAKLVHVDPGFNPRDATSMRISLPAKKYPEGPQRLAFTDALLERISGLPSVQAVGLTQSLPLNDDYVLSFQIQGRPVSPSDKPHANFYAVTPGYFRAMGIRLLRGRTFTAQDDGKAMPVALVNETFARRFFPHEDPIGHRVNISGGANHWAEVVGMVADVTQYGVEQAMPAQAYEPFAQRPYGGFNVVIRTVGAPAVVTGALRPSVYAVDRDQPVGSITPLDEIFASSLARQRFGMLLLAVFSVVALVIAAVGIYGVISYNVSQRTGEIGIRIALGAQSSDVLRLIVRHGGRLVGIGLLLGLVAALAGGRLIAALLFQTSPHDPLTLAAITVLLTAVALLACLLPARRATRIDPIVALRAE